MLQLTYLHPGAVFLFPPGPAVILVNVNDIMHYSSGIPAFQSFDICDSWQAPLTRPPGHHPGLCHHLKLHLQNPHAPLSTHNLLSSSRLAMLLPLHQFIFLIWTMHPFPPKLQGHFYPHRLSYLTYSQSQYPSFLLSSCPRSCSDIIEAAGNATVTGHSWLPNPTLLNPADTLSLTEYMAQMGPPNLPAATAATPQSIHSTIFLPSFAFLFFNLF